MSHHHHHHQAVDNLINVFARASHDLTVVHSKLDKEFQQIYPDNANPMKLVQRIKKLQEDVTLLKDQCLELLSAKQIIDEWTMQVRSRTVGETEEADKEDINKMLFSAIVHTN